MNDDFQNGKHLNASTRRRKNTTVYPLRVTRPARKLRNSNQNGKHSDASVNGYCGWPGRCLPFATRTQSAPNRRASRPPRNSAAFIFISSTCILGAARHLIGGPTSAESSTRIAVDHNPDPSLRRRKNFTGRNADGSKDQRQAYSLCSVIRFRNHPPCGHGACIHRTISGPLPRNDAGRRRPAREVSRGLRRPRTHRARLFEGEPTGR